MRLDDDKMKRRIDPDLAKLFRWIVLPLGVAATVVGLGLQALTEGPRNPDWKDYAFSLSPLIAAALLILLAGWLRVQEALDPANEGLVSRSLWRHVGVYAGFSLAVCLVLILLLMSSKQRPRSILLIRNAFDRSG